MSAVQYSLGLGSYFFKPCRIFQQVLHYLLGDVDFVLVGKNEVDGVLEINNFLYAFLGFGGCVNKNAVQHAASAGFYGTDPRVAETVIFAAGLFRAGGGVSHNIIKIA